MKVISVKIPDSDNNLLESIVGDEPGAKSVLVREAVRQYCAKQSTGQKRKNAVIDKVFGAFNHAPLDAKKHREKLSEKML
jgi:metal-responsive CopG/Arc/MetJ family transcriptional regulator